MLQGQPGQVFLEGHPSISGLSQAIDVIAAIFLVIPKVRDSKWKPVNHRSASLSQGKDALPFHARGCLFPLSSPLLGKGEGTLVIHCFDEQIKLGAK